MNIWDEIYAKGEWGEGSGAGSTVETTKRYVEVVNEYLDKHQYKNCKVYDFGCGLWSGWQENLHLNGWRYYGVDESSEVIKKNSENHPDTFTHRFNTGKAEDYLRGIGEGFPHLRPSIDIILIKDVFQHLSFDTIYPILELIKKPKAVIITNDSVLDGVNRDCEDGGYRPIDLRLPPFNLKPTRVVDYPSSPHQKTILIFEK